MAAMVGGASAATAAVACRHTALDASQSLADRGGVTQKADPWPTIAMATGGSSRSAMVAHASAICQARRSRPCAISMGSGTRR